MISTGPGNSLEARDSQIQGTQQQNAPMYLSTNPHGRNPVAPLPLECSHLTPKSFKVLSAFPSYLQTPDLSLSTQFGMAPVHGSHWILGIFNSEIEMSLEGKQVCHAMPHALLQRVVAQYACPISQPKTRSKSLAKNMGIETWPPYRVFEVTKALDIQGLEMLLG